MHPATGMGNGCGASFWPESFCDLLAQGGRRVIRFDQEPYDRAHLVGLSRPPRAVHHPPLTPYWSNC